MVINKKGYMDKLNKQEIKNEITEYLKSVGISLEQLGRDKFNDATINKANDIFIHLLNKNLVEEKHRTTFFMAMDNEYTKYQIIKMINGQ